KSFCMSMTSNAVRAGSTRTRGCTSYSGTSTVRLTPASSLRPRRLTDAYDGPPVGVLATPLTRAHRRRPRRGAGRPITEVLRPQGEHSGAGLQHEVQGRLRGAADRAEAALEHHLAQTGLAGLGAQPGAARLRERSWCADERGEAVVHAPDGVE